jgi:hypothetical protein
MRWSIEWTSLSAPSAVWIIETPSWALRIACMDTADLRPQLLGDREPGRIVGRPVDAQAAGKLLDRLGQGEPGDGEVPLGVDRIDVVVDPHGSASLAVSLSAGTSLRRLSVLRDRLAVARGRPVLAPPRPAAGPPFCSPLSAGHPAHSIGKEVPVRAARPHGAATPSSADRPPPGSGRHDRPRATTGTMAGPLGRWIRHHLTPTRRGWHPPVAPEYPPGDAPHWHDCRP